MKIIDGGVTAAKGFKAASTAAEIKYKGRTDMAMVFSEVPCVAAGTFTTNVVKAAPVRWDQDIVYNHPGARAVICNSGIANGPTNSIILVAFLGCLYSITQQFDMLTDLAPFSSSVIRLRASFTRASIGCASSI